MANKVQFAISHALAVRMTAGGDDAESAHKTAPLSDREGLSGHGTDRLPGATSDVDSAQGTEPLSGHGTHAHYPQANEVLPDPMQMMTEPSTGSDVTVLSGHGTFSIHLPQTQTVSRVEFGRNEHGDLIVILHE